jgi:hypothetical protein
MPTTINIPKEANTFIPLTIKGPIITSWILFFVILLISTISFFLIQPEIPLFYSLGTKQDQLAPKMFIFIFPLTSLIINLVHFFIAKILLNFSVVLTKLFIGITIAFQFLISFALIRIIFITF